MTIRKTLTLLALPALLISGEAAARPCPYVGCGTEIAILDDAIDTTTADDG